MVWGRADDPLSQAGNTGISIGLVELHNLMVTRIPKAKVAIATILSNDKRNVLEAHCLMTPHVFDNIGRQR